MTEKELSHLTKLIKEVSLSPDADEKIALILKMASESITEDKIKGLVDKDDKRKVKSGILKFSKKEMDKMPTSLKNLFAHNDIIVRYRYYKGLFQARYRKNGMNIEVASTDFNTMKRKFIAKLCEGQGDTVQPKQTKSTVTFADCAQAWLKLKERTTKPSTYKEYLRSYNVNLQPVFGDYRLCEITRGMVQDYLFSFVDKGNHRTAEKLKLQLKCIFDLAAEDYKIPSPMNKIVLPYRQTKKRQSIHLCGRAQTRGLLHAKARQCGKFRTACSSLFRVEAERACKYSGGRRQISGVRDEQGAAGKKCRSKADPLHARVSARGKVC